jgi:hypothetical protein
VYKVRTLKTTKKLKSGLKLVQNDEEIEEGQEYFTQATNGEFYIFQRDEFSAPDLPKLISKNIIFIKI